MGEPNNTPQGTEDPGTRRTPFLARNAQVQAMSELPFSKWSPCGNTTIFFNDTVPSGERRELAQKCLGPGELAAEQVGFISPSERHLAMAGGEFCLNAARAFGAYLLHAMSTGSGDEEKTFTITVSGWPHPMKVSCRGKCPHFTAMLTLPLPAVTVSPVGEGLALVRLPGITHLLLDTTLHPFPRNDRSRARQTALDFQKRLRLTEEACFGCIWWKNDDAGCAIIPLVHVLETDTLIFEQSCGSGSLALAIHLLSSGESHLSVGQPAGSSLAISMVPERREVLVEGSVDLIAEGTYFG